jgi:beta-lactam-binding protein with PASTA domain
VFADVDPGSSLVGIVVTQSPPSGTRLDAGDVVTIQTARPDRSPRSGWPTMKKDEQGLFRAIEHLYD